MKRYIKAGALALLGAATMVACKEEEVYKTSVTRDIELTLNGVPYNVNYGQDDDHDNQRLLFIYRDNGAYLGNWGTSHRMALEDGDYKIFATQQVTLITPPTNLSDEVIEQDPETNQVLAISDVASYTAGNTIRLDIKTRTGMLRLKALDEKADKSYSTIKAVYTTPVTGYKVSTARVVTGDPIELVREKATAGGGVGYLEDAIILGSADHDVEVRLDYLDDNGNVVRSKPFADAIRVLPNDTTEVTFNLNDANERVIVNYNVTLASTRWTEEDIYPSIKVDVPDGYTYVAPDESLNNVLAEQMADDAVSEIKLYLKANSSYSVTTGLRGITKPLKLLGQTPGFGQSLAQVTISSTDGYADMSGTIDHISFENIRFVPASRFFNIRNQAFDVETIEFIDCEFDNWNGGVLWYQTSNADHQQTVGTMRFTGCRVTNFTASTSALFRPQTSRLSAISNWEITGNLFHGKSFGTRVALVQNLSKIDGALTINVENNIFIDTKGGAFTYFDIDCASASSSTLTVKNNTISGASAGTGTWFTIANTGTVDAQGNTRTAGYTMSAYGVAEPAESATTYQDLLNQQNL